MSGSNALQITDPNAGNALAQAPSWADAAQSVAGTVSSGVDALGQWLAAQRAKSAQMGLWNPQTGLPTGAGLVNAAGQYGNALMMGTTAPGGTSPEIASMDPIEHMLAQIKADPKSKWGLRITEDPIEGGPGTVLPPSRIWDDGEPTDKTLEGTSTIGIAGANRSSVEQALARGGINSDTPWNYYPGEHVHLVKGDTAKQGYDNDERIIPDAQLVASYRKQNAGPSPRLPMTPVAP